MFKREIWVVEHSGGESGDWGVWMHGLCLSKSEAVEVKQRLEQQHAPALQFRVTLYAPAAPNESQ